MCAQVNLNKAISQYPFKLWVKVPQKTEGLLLLLHSRNVAKTCKVPQRAKNSMLPFQHRIHRVHEVMKGVFGLVALSETTADMGKSEGFPFVTQNVVGSVTFGSPGAITTDIRQNVRHTWVIRRYKAQKMMLHLLNRMIQASEVREVVMKFNRIVGAPKTSSIRQVDKSRFVQGLVRLTTWTRPVESSKPK